MKYICGLIAIFISANTLAFANTEHTFIEHKELFRDRVHYQSTLSPNSEFLSYLRRTSDDTFLDLYNIQTNTKRGLLKVSNDDFSIGGYIWLTPRIVLLNLYKGGERTDYLYTFSTNGNGSNNKISGEYFRINDGYIVDSLDADANKVIYAKNTYFNNRETQMLYRISIDNLKRNRFSDKDKIDEAPRFLTHYEYDVGFSRIIGHFVENKPETKGNSSRRIVSIKYREIDNTTWREVVRLEDVDYKMEAVGFVDENNLAILSNKQSDKVALQMLNVTTKEITETLYQHDKYDLTAATLSDSGKLLNVSYVEGGITQIDWLSQQDMVEVDSQELAKITGEPYLVKFDQTEGIALLYIRGSNNPGEFYIYNRNTEELRFIVANYPGINNKQLAQTKSYKISSQEGVEIEAFLTQPKQDSLNHNTLIVMPHGGPIGVRDYSAFNPQVQFLTNRGFSVLQVNFRGSVGYGKEFMKQGVGQFGQLIEQDITLVVDDLLSKQDFEHICAVGSSYGAYSSMMLAMDQPERFDCVVASFGVFDLPLLFNRSNFRSGEKYSEYIARTVGENDAEKINISPVYRANELQAPALIIAGKLDQVTGFEQANRMRFMLEEAQKLVEFLMYDKSGHGHYTYKAQQHHHLATVDFIYRHLGLVYPEPANINDANTKVLANDFVSLGLALSENGVAGLNLKQALNYFISASKYDDALATFNVGAHYHRGDQVERSIAKALEYYERALALGFKETHERLAFIYMFEPSVAQDDEKALYHIQQALEVDDSFSNTLYKSAFYCISKTAYRDVEQCIKRLKETRKLSSNVDDQAEFKRTIGRILAKGDLTNEQAKSMHAFTRYSFDLRMDTFEVKETENGLYYYQPDERFGYSGDYKKYNMSSVDSARKTNRGDVYLGIRLSLDNKRPPTSTQTALMAVVWEAQYNNGDIRVLSNDVIIASSKQGLNSFVLLPSDEVNTPRFKVKVYDSFGKLRYSHEFTDMQM